MEPPAAAAEAQQAVVGQPRDIFADDAHSSDDDFCSDAPDFSFDNWSLLPGPVAGSNNDRGLLEVASTGGQQHNEEEQQAVVEQPRVVVDGVAQSSDDASLLDFDLDFDLSEDRSEWLAVEEQQAVADGGDVADQAADSSPVNPRDIFAGDAHSSDDNLCSDSKFDESFAPDFSFDNWSPLPGPVAGSNDDAFDLLEVASTGGQQHNEEEQQAVVEQPRVVDGVAQSSNDASHSDVDLDFDFDEVLSELLAGEEQQAVADSGDVADQAADSSPVKRRRQSANDTVGVTRLIYEAMTTKVPLKSMDAHFGGKRRAAVRKLTLMARHYAQPTESSSREAETRRFTFEGLVELGLTVQEARDLMRLARALGRGMLREGHTANVQKKHLKKYVWTHSRPSASVHDMQAGIVAHEAA